MSDASAKPRQLAIDPAVALPHYTDFQSVSFGQNGFTIDFGQTVPGTEQTVVRTRVVMVPATTFFEFVAMCEEAMDKYKVQFLKEIK